MAKRKKNEKVSTGNDEIHFDNPFAALRPASGASTQPTTQATAKEESKPTKEKWPRMVVLQMERKGRGGKTVTLVSKSGFEGEALEGFVKRLKQSLGTGGSLEGAHVVLQGDVRKRLRAFLESKGVRVKG